MALMIILFGGGKSNLIVSKIENGVVRTNENISQDPQWSTWWRDIETKETTDTFCLTSRGNLIEHKQRMSY